MSIGRLFGWSD